MQSDRTKILQAPSVPHRPYATICYTSYHLLLSKVQNTTLVFQGLVMCLPMFRHRHRRDGHASSGPDYYLPIFKQTDLNDYNPSTYECKAVPADIEAIEAILSSQTSDRETRGIRQGDLFDHDDHEFYSRQKVQGFPQRAYSDKFFQSSEQNPEKWCEIGVTFRGHASVVIHDITGADTDKPKKYFEYLGIAKEEPQSSRVGDIIRLHLARRRGDNEYDLWFHHPRTDEESGRYYSVCRIRTTDRMIKYNAGLSFPRYYKKVTSDCATFAHNFLVKTLNCVYAEGHIEKKKLDSIVKNLVKHNHVAEGTVGETEGVSRRNKVLGDTGGTLLESGGTLVGSS